MPLPDPESRRARAASEGRQPGRRQSSSDNRSGRNAAPGSGGAPAARGGAKTGRGEPRRGTDARGRYEPVSRSGRPARSTEGRPSTGARRNVRDDRGGRSDARDQTRDQPRGRSGARTGSVSGDGRGRPQFRQNAEEARAPKTWGSLARKGTRQLKEEGAGPASTAWRDAVARSRGEEGAASAPGAWEPEVWKDDGESKPAVRRPSVRSRGKDPRAKAGPRARAEAPAPEPRQRKPKTLPPEVASEVADAVGGAKLAVRVNERLTAATGAYERERFSDALRMLKPLAEQAPGAASVRELLGLTLYRLGRWEAAIKELEAFRTISDSLDQHPALADCYRAKKRWRHVDELWEELRRSAPAPDVLAEGRLVMAGSLAERSRMAEAIELLERAKTDQKKPKMHHLRTWYALADLYERAGEIPRARELFRRILMHDPDSFDVAERLSSIR